MELESGLSWHKFRKRYSTLHRGSSMKQVGAAWKEYKESGGEGLTIRAVRLGKPFAEARLVPAANSAGVSSTIWYVTKNKLTGAMEPPITLETRWVFLVLTIPFRLTSKYKTEAAVRNITEVILSHYEGKYLNYDLIDVKLVPDKQAIEIILHPGNHTSPSDVFFEFVLTMLVIDPQSGPFPFRDKKNLDKTITKLEKNMTKHYKDKGWPQLPTWKRSPTKLDVYIPYGAITEEVAAHPNPTVLYYPEEDTLKKLILEFDKHIKEPIYDYDGFAHFILRLGK